MEKEILKLVDFVYIIRNDNFSKSYFLDLIIKIKSNIKEFANFCRNIYFICKPKFDISDIEGVYITDSIYDIDELSSSFLLFNRTYIFKTKVTISDFFKDGCPKDTLEFSPLIPSTNDPVFDDLNILGIINNCYVKNNTKSKRKYFFNIRYGLLIVLNNFFLNLFDSYLGFKERFSPIPIESKTLGVFSNLNVDEKIKGSVDFCKMIRALQLVTCNFTPSRCRKLSKKVYIQGDVNNEK